jgi:hypothetical protein
MSECLGEEEERDACFAMPLPPSSGSGRRRCAVRRSARALDLEAPALEPSEDQVQIVSTRAYDIEYAEEEFVFEPY